MIGRLLMLTSLLVLTLIGVANAQSGKSEIEMVRDNVARILPASLAVTAIEQTDMEGVYLVTAGPQILYVYSKDQFVMIGEVYDTERRVSWTQERKDHEKLVAMTELDKMPESEMIIMGDPQGERYVTVFTDTDCGWCQKFHKDIPALKRGGLKVRYMMWPRAGLHSDSYDEAVSVWCADNQGEAMTIAKARKQVESRICDNPVKQHYELGFRLGVQGTPFVMLDTGEVVGGYVPPEKLLSQAGLN